jgi:hypothetical protein
MADMRANVTRAAEGLDRRSFSVAEILRMQTARSIVERHPDNGLTSATLPGLSARLGLI